MNNILKCQLWLIPLFFLLCTFNSNGQILTYGSKSATVIDVINHIKKNTSYNIIYSKNNISKLNETKSFEYKTWDPINLLNSFIANTNLAFVFTDSKTIVLKEITDDNIKLTENIKGHIFNEDGNPLFGATIWDLANNTSTQTDKEGNFEFSINKDSKILITFIGYENRILDKITKDNIIHLKRSEFSLNEVQITGYINTSKRLSTATIGSIESKDIANQANTNILSAINGRIPGVNVVQSNGLPGSGILIKIRGDNTLGRYGNSNTDPLYIIDGVPQINGSSSYDQRLKNNVFGMGGQTNVFSSLNPNNIERIDILKDADATAIYGARGANGVIIITTKKGTASPINFELNYGIGFSKKQKDLELINTADYLKLRNDALKNDNLTPNNNNAPDITLWNANYSNNYYKTLTKNIPTNQTINISSKGGSEYIQFFTGVNFSKDGTIIDENEFYKKYGIINNISLNSKNSKFKSLVSLNYNAEKSILPLSNYYNLIGTAPNYNGKNADGTFYFTPYFENPLAAIESKLYNNSNIINISNSSSYDITPNLVFKIATGYSTLQNNANARTPSSSKNPYTRSNTLGESRFANTVTSNFNLEPQLIYTKTINQHKIIGLIGSNYSTANTNINILNGLNYSNDEQLSSITGAGIIRPNNSVDEYKYNSGFVRLSYDYDNKYLINGNVRKDASSRFASNNNQKLFYSLGTAWIFSNEKLFENTNWLSFGKLKLSYGTTGNDRIENYLYMMNFVPYEIKYTDIPTITIDKIPNPDLKWETTRKLETGLSIGLWNDKIIVDANYYRNTTRDLINSVMRPAQGGFYDMLMNIDAIVENKGFEFEISYNKDFNNINWVSKFNISFEKNKLLEYKDLENSTMANYYTVGAPVDAFTNLLKYKFDKIDQTSGRAIFYDVNNDNVINYLDRYIIPYKTPYTAGFFNRINYKNLSMSFFFKMANKIQEAYFSNATINYFGDIGNYDSQVMSYLTKNNMWPSPSIGNTVEYGEYFKLLNSDVFTQRVNYIKLKDLSIDYNIPQKILKKSNIQITTYIRAQNLWFWSSLKNVIDPEIGPIAYPLLKTYQFGCKLTF